jgi:hypothetical protein
MRSCRKLYAIICDNISGSKQYATVLAELLFWDYFCTAAYKSLEPCLTVFYLVSGNSSNLSATTETSRKTF